MRAGRWVVALGALMGLVWSGGMALAQLPPVPVANFTGSPVTGLAPLQVNLTDLSTGGPTQWVWSFGDGRTSVVQNPGHLYTTPGVYTVTLTVRNTAGANTLAKPAYITVLATPPPAPIAQFRSFPASGPAPLTVQFTDQSANFPFTWSWDFGDGGTSAEKNPTHRYTAAGAFTVTLTVSNPAGTSTVTRANAITVIAPPAPVTNFLASPTSGSAPLTVKFTDLSTNNPTTWTWDFGDGATSRDENPTHVYTKFGSFTVSLTAGTAGGATTKTKPNLIQVRFVDVPAGFWAQSEIAAAVNAGLFTGFPGGTFQPNGTVTRDQVSVVLARAIAGGEAKVPSGPATASFSDVPKIYWAYKYIEFVSGRGVITGFPDGTFRPTQAVTRADMATFLARVVAGGDANVPEFTGTPTFSDVPSTSPSLKYIEFARARGIVQGFPDGTFRPEEVVTRDQMAVFLVRALHLSG